MAIYSVYRQAGGKPDEVRLAKDGPSLLALLLPPVFLAWNRLWLALAAYLCLELLFLILARTGAGTVSAVLSVLPGLFLFMHGNQLVRSRLERFGWQEVAVVSADTMDDAEVRFFHGTKVPTDVLEPSGLSASVQKAAMSVMPGKPEPRPLGIFPE